MKVHRMLGFAAMLAVTPFVRTATASATDCREYFYDGFNYSDNCYLSLGALLADCKYYCSQSPNEGGGYCTGYHDYCMGCPTEEEGYCQCDFCIT